MSQSRQGRTGWELPLSLLPGAPGLTSYPGSPAPQGPQRPSVAGTLSLDFTERTRVQSSLLDPGTGLPATSAQGGSIVFSGTKAPPASPATPSCPSPMLHGHWAWLPLRWLPPLTQLLPLTRLPNEALCAPAVDPSAHSRYFWVKSRS